jgi:hypothetical protein
MCDRFDGGGLGSIDFGVGSIGFGVMCDRFDGGGLGSIDFGVGFDRCLDSIDRMLDIIDTATKVEYLI